MSGSLGDIFMDVFELTFSDFIEEIIFIFGSERVVSLEDYEEEDS